MVNTLTFDPLTLAYHELRSPLGLVATAARSAAEESQDDALRARWEVIVRTVDRMLRTAQQVFGAAQAGNRDAPVWFAPFDVVSRLVDDLQGFDVAVDLAVDGRTRPARAFGVCGLFEALAQSLVSNAVDHSEPGARVRVRLTADADTLTLTVVNTAAARRRHNGLGVGLYICDRLAAQLGGTLSAGLEGREYRASFRMPLAGDAVDGRPAVALLRGPGHEPGSAANI
jgi:signal transduction histidine kinase